MAGWVVTVDPLFPQHVEYALRDGVWDTKKRYGVEPGDDLFFYLMGPNGGLTAHALAESAMRPLGPTDSLPWDPNDPRDYKYRTRLRKVSRQPQQSYRWSDMQDLFGSRARSNHSIIKVKDPRGLDKLRASFRVDVAWGPETDETLDGIQIPLDQDMRTQAVRAVRERRGQSAFRQALLRAYRRCMVTGTSVDAVLEAAHISPYRGAHTNDPANGLLLRADVHTLFDLNLLTVLPDLTVRVAPSLADSAYAGGWDGDILTIPHDARLRPEPTLLEKHNANCAWLP